MTLHIACVIDRRYVPHCGVMLQSLLTNSRDTPVEIHLLHGGDLTGRDLDDLGGIARRSGAALHAIPVDPARLDGLPLTPRFPPPEWYRLLLPELLPRLDRVLCLDSDLVVLQSLRPLWEIALGDALLGAVTDPLFSFHDRRWVALLGVHSERDYFNSGVLLMNLVAMRRENSMAAAAQFARTHTGPLPYPYQDTVNALFHSRRHVLHPRWNVQTSFYERPLARLPFDLDEVRDAMARPAIMHYLGLSKPWHYRCTHPHREIYAHYRAQTPWADWTLEGRTLKNRLMRLLPDRMARLLALSRAAFTRWTS